MSFNDMLTSGIGLVGLDITVTFFLILAIFMIGAVLRAPDVVETTLSEISLRIKFGGLMIIAARYIYVLVVHGDVIVPPITQLGLLFIVLGVCVNALCKLFPHVNEIDERTAQQTIRAYMSEIYRMQTFVDKRKNHTGRAEDKVKHDRCDSWHF